MRRSQFFCPTLKETPKDAAIPSHQLMLRTGMIHQTTSGIYSWLPMGQKVLRTIEDIIQKEMDEIGFQRVIMPTIQPADLWKESRRYDAYGKEMLKIKDRHDRDMLYAPTSEEVATDIMRNFIHSYKSLPQHLYQINWKFRDEIRPRFGVMRGREFFMKDGYSFDLTEEAARQTYSNISDAYLRIFDTIFKGVPNVKAKPIKADAGPIGGDLSHEFQIEAPTGEMELGHIFYYGDKYSKALDFKVTGEDGKPVYPLGGCYGIGVSRVVAAIIEVSHDDRGIIWPTSVAPYKIGLVDLIKEQGPTAKIYDMLRAENIDALWDDRTDASPGMKFAEMDLLGMPYQIIVGKKWQKDEMVELKDRRTGEIKSLSLDVILDEVKDLL